MRKQTFIQRTMALVLAAIMLLSNSAYAFVGWHVCHEHCHIAEQADSCCAAHSSHHLYSDVQEAFVDPHPHHCGCGDAAKQVPALDTELLLALGQLLAPLPAQHSLLSGGERVDYLIDESPNVYALLRTGRDILTFIAVLLI